MKYAGNQSIQSPLTRNPDHMGQLPYISLGNLKSFCEAYNIQINLIMKPDQIKVKVIQIDRATGLQSKSQSLTIDNNMIVEKFTLDNLNRMIRGVLAEVY
jgi:hypothetical protein